ncbi:uncharacterized protein [Diadema antillarum]|uniref:uncharacterized protein n=1 Tax=Diadema antillarum TaxID=105358 RepID=UPI003A8886C0
MATFHQISSQNLECPICLTLFNQPKSLTCSHTFCKGCLERVSQTQPNQQTITCPVCRKGTPVPSGDVSKLQTNVPLNSLVDEVKTKNPTLVPVSEVLSGKVPLRRRRKCKTHPSVDEDCYCIHCRENICSTCGMLEHLQAGHQLEKAAVHEEKVMKNIKELQEWAKLKKTTIENHIDCIETQHNEITNMMRKLDDDIDKTYEEYIQLLTDRREAMKCQVQRLSEKFEKELQTMKEESRQTVSHVNAMEELVTNGVKVPLERDALFAHDTLCENLKSFLKRDDPYDQSPRTVTERAKMISFRRYGKVNELCLGELEGFMWNVKADIELPRRDSMNCMTRAPDGMMAVGSWKGGIYLFSPDGELQQTVLKDVGVLRIGFLSDGQSVVRDEKNKMSLYTPQWEKLDVTFETMSADEGGSGGLTVDRDNNIYVSYRKSKKIQVFTPQGGKAVREVMCDGYEPQQIFSFQSNEKLIMRDVSGVVCLDGKGKKENVLEKEGVSDWPAVCRDDSVIVAWVKHEEGLVSIDRYTRDLEHVHNIVTDFKIQHSERGWYYLQEFESGEIAVCTSDILYIFDAI